MSGADESTPLVARFGVDGDKSSSPKPGGRERVKNFIIAALVAAVLFLWIDGQRKERNTAVEISKEIDASKKEAPVPHRPICKYYGELSSVTMVQTSLQDPSQQWSTVECVKAPQDAKGPLFGRRNATQAVKLNEYGAPDAIIQVEFEKVAHPDREPIMGFGGAFTEASSLNYHSLSVEGQDAVMELLFGKSGLGYRWVIKTMPILVFNVQ